MAQPKHENFSGEDVRHLRQLKGLKQEEAGKRMSITQQAYSLIEKKESVALPLLLTVLAALNSSIEELCRIRDMV